MAKTSARRIAVLEHRCEAFELRKQGYSFKEIGRLNGYSRQRAHQLVTAAMAELIEKERESAEQVLAMELARLDQDQRVTVDVLCEAYGVNGGGGEDPDGTKEEPPSGYRLQDPELALKALDRRARIGDRRARLLGLGPAELGSKGNPFRVAPAQWDGVSEDELVAIASGKDPES